MLVSQDQRYAARAANGRPYAYPITRPSASATSQAWLLCFGHPVAYLLRSGRLGSKEMTVSVT